MKSLCENYDVNPTWLLLGIGEPCGRKADVVIPKMAMMAVSDPVEQLLVEEEERAGISLTPEQRSAILKILRELVSRDVRSIRELLHVIKSGEKQGDES